MELVERLTAEADTPSSAVDYREAIAKIEQLLLSPQFASQLIGNQALDFLKQDGITEIEESVMANAVERKMNLELRADEEGGKVFSLHQRQNCPSPYRLHPEPYTLVILHHCLSVQQPRAAFAGHPLSC